LGSGLPFPDGAAWFGWVASYLGFAGASVEDILKALVQAVSDQTIALGQVADQVTALKQTLARQFPDLADELKGQIAADAEKSRTGVYELQVSLAKVREAIAALPKLEETRKASKTAARGGGRRAPRAERPGAS
jgi:hypothetical protein